MKSADRSGDTPQSQANRLLSIYVRLVVASVLRERPQVATKGGTPAASLSGMRKIHPTALPRRCLSWLPVCHCSLVSIGFLLYAQSDPVAIEVHTARPRQLHPVVNNPLWGRPWHALVVLCTPNRIQFPKR